MKIVDSIICLFTGHKYSRLERRGSVCVHCGKTKRMERKLENNIDRRNTTVDEIKFKGE
jgi:hypothetical protein